MAELTVTINAANEEKIITMACPPSINAEDLCTLLCHKLHITPVAKNLFALRKHDSKVFLAGNSLLEKVNNLDLRIRYKVPSLMRLKQIDIETYFYYFHQARKDVLDNNVPEIIYSKHREELFGLGITDMYRVMIQDGKTYQNLIKDYKKYIPREVTKKHSIFTKKPIYSTLVGLQKNHRTAEYVIEQYLQQLDLLAPNYLSEDYDVRIERNNSFYDVKLYVMPFHKEQPGLRIYFEKRKEWEHLCTIDELCFMSMRRDSNTIEISRKNGIPVYLMFPIKADMFSFVSLCDGYYRLMIKWTFNICGDVSSPLLQHLHSIKCHGPVGGEFSYHKLEEKRSNKTGCFIVRQCDQQYDVYCIDVCVKNSTKPKTYKIKRENDSFSMIFNNREYVYKSIPELVASNRNPDGHIYLQECLPPSDYEKSQLLLCEPSGHNTASDINHDDVEKLLAVNKGPRCIDTKDLLVYEGTKVESSENLSCFYRGRWHVAEGKKMDVAMKMLKRDASDALLKDFINHAGEWAFLKSPVLVRLYGIMLRSPVAMIMEYLHLGSLDVYLRKHTNDIQPEELMQAAASLATALWYLAEHGIVHGNIRCYKMLVASHDRFQFSVKLSNQGLESSFNEQEIHWIPTEYFSNRSVAHLFPSSDVWAFATTLWEIFSYGKSPADTKQPLAAHNYLNGHRLVKPVECPREIYGIMRSCWHADPHSRCRPQLIMRDVNHLFYQVYNSRLSHSYATVSPRSGNSNILKSGEDCLVNFLSASDAEGNASSICNSRQTSLTDDGETLDDDDTISSDFSTIHADFDFSNRDFMQSQTENCLQSIFEFGDYNVVLQGLVGRGFYGFVFKGSLQKDGECESRLVAVKKLISNSEKSQLEDFDQEIKIAKTLKHRNIVEILGVVEEPEILLIMEFVPHGSLKSYLNIYQSSISKTQLLNYALDVARGMEYLETKNVVHRDLAARNILVVDESHVKISDFGLARKIDKDGYYELKSDRALPLNWYAPESKTDGKFSTKSDVWSYGITLWEMFSFGVEPPPWDLNITQDRLSSYLPCPDFCPNEVYETLMTACWKLKPVDRPNFTQLLANGGRLLS
ncbi:tyrosine-protein kinase hopscotch [Arctopsyche grandis]|uniref:tyrosine-protein kinase hopscotch n=1 Tax=Arctopsyche grandis TaxID=121162 RepID=UPI00406D64A8